MCPSQETKGVKRKSSSAFYQSIRMPDSANSSYQDSNRDDVEEDLNESVNDDDEEEESEEDETDE
jgi:hypothetical protein